MKIKRALISVTDKTGIVDFSKSLEKMGVEIISTGGTAKLLKDSGINVTYIGDYTGFPEIMDGRVRTLHPKIHGGILAVRKNKDHMDQINNLKIEPIDMVVVNLYQFEKTIENPDVEIDEAIENIDIGGPSMLRSAAKNYKDVLVVTDPKDYGYVIEKLEKHGDVDLKTRELFSLKAFRRTADYDSEIDKFLSRRFANENILRLKFTGGKELRYGENWHQKAKVYSSGDGLVNAVQLQGKEMSYNNYIDSQSAIEAANDLKEDIGVAIIKHTNPCGFATGKTVLEATEQAWNGDPVSAFGSVIAITKTVDGKTAEFLKDKFVEVVIAPNFDSDALKVFSQKKNLRLLKMEKTNSENKEYRFLSGGVLEQDCDNGYSDKFENVTKIKPPSDKNNLALFACLACKHTKSNAIVVAREYEPGFYHIIGMGAGQPNRIGSLKIAAEKTLDNFNKMGMDNSEISKCILASDSFFPFPDSIEESHKHGFRFIVQPGGSVKDKEVIGACDKLGIAMTFTGRRMFKH
ncbi:MAG: bifunctional phosphoribosylaminoimidazolecarboxamide formyltransferase/IMP cyclohydrolase [Candidatus Aenigmarchaeota archaeon]|nr:bifunctional phosphoribosylaminoimidazolecarboxamide formyltransferase/IMP cyclohydrolase [Candidatus Aenigmarchaeota archaeon]